MANARREMAALAFAFPVFVMLGKCTTATVRSAPTEAASFGKAVGKGVPSGTYREYRKNE